MSKMNLFRKNQASASKQANQKSLGQSLTQDGIHYLLALCVKVIQDNSGYTEDKAKRR